MKGYPRFLAVRGDLDGRDQIKASGGGAVTGEEGIAAAPWPEAAGVLGHGPSGHHMAREWDESTEDLKANSPSSIMEVETSHGRRAAGGRWTMATVAA